MNHSPTSTLLTRLKALAARRPLALFLAVAFGFVYPLMSLPILAQYGVIPGASAPAMFGLDMERAASLLIVIPGLVLATVLVTVLEGGRPAVRALYRRVFKWRIGLAWWLITVVALPATTIALAILMGDSLRMPSAGVLAGEVVASTVAFLFVNLWEETGWTGFFQSRLERRYNFFIAAALTAIPFAAIHSPLHVINGKTDPAALAQAFVLLVIVGVIFRPLIGMALRGTGDSVMAAALMHTFFNRSNNIDGIAADLLTGPNRPLAALHATVLLTVGLGLSIRRQLTRAYRRELDAMNSAAVILSGDRSMSARGTRVA